MYEIVKFFPPECRSEPAPIDLPVRAHNMKYMLLIYMDEQALSPAEREKCYQESAEFAQELHTSRQFLGAGPLHPTSTATSVRTRDGNRMVTDGPFAETREQ